MLSPRWRKMLRDASLHKARTSLVVLAVATAMIGAGSLLDAWALVQRVTAMTYRASHPVSATLKIDRVDDALLADVRALPEISAVRARSSAVATLESNGTRVTAELHALQDFDARDIGRLESVRGNWPPRDGEIAIEQSALELSGAALDGSVSLRMGKSPVQALRVSGIAHDVSLPPGWMDHVVYGFVTPPTMATLGAPSSFNELQFVVRDVAADRDAVRRTADKVRRLAEQRGRPISGIDVPVPGQHAHAAQMDSLMMTQGAFGLLTLLVASFLIVNLMTAMLSGQAREIGVMKSLGARVDQIAAMYLAFALLIGVLASAIAVPIAIAIGRPYAALKADMLNFSIDGYAIPWWAIALQLLVGCLLPVAAAAAPIMRACRRSVAATLRDPGIAVADGGFHVRKRFAMPGIGRPLQLSIGNAFRQRQRMLLTLLALSAGGAVYIGADNLRSSVRGSVDLLFASQRYDVVLRLAEPQDGATIEAIAARVAGVKRTQGLASVSAQFSNADGIVGDTFPLLALPDKSPMLLPTMTQGRWLTAPDRTALVVSRALMKDEPAFAAGASIALLIEGRSTPWTIVGVVDAGPQKLAYAPLPTLDELRGDARVSSLLVAGTDSSAASALDLIARLRAEFDRAGIAVAGSQVVGEARRAFEDHLLMVVQFLGVMGWVMTAVGGMGLASTMSLAVLERTREIGVMRAIGARHATIARLIQAEGIVIAVLAWLLALPLSVPVSVALADAFGKVMFTVPTHVIPDAGGVLRWLLMSVVVSIAACAWPSRRATRIPTAAALNYE